jgi:hypothetical protein
MAAELMMAWCGHLAIESTPPVSSGKSYAPRQSGCEDLLPLHEKAHGGCAALRPAGNRRRRALVRLDGELRPLTGHQYLEDVRFRRFSLV